MSFVIRFRFLRLKQPALRGDSRDLCRSWADLVRSPGTTAFHRVADSRTSAIVRQNGCRVRRGTGRFHSPETPSCRSWCLRIHLDEIGRAEVLLEPVAGELLIGRDLFETSRGISGIKPVTEPLTNGNLLSIVY